MKTQPHQTTKIPSDLPGCGWYEILPPPPPPTPLTQNITTDWLIIGAGFTGLTAAKRLTERRPNDSIAILDAQRIAQGSAGRNSGFMTDLPHDLTSKFYAGKLKEDQKQIRMNRTAINYAASIVEQFNLHEHFSLSGKYHAAVDQRGMKRLSDFCAHLDKLNEPYTRLNQHQMEKITGAHFYTGGIHAPGAAVLQPSGYIRGLAAGLQCFHNVNIYENSPVIKIDHGHAHTAHTPNGKVTAARIILAVNGHAQSLGFHRNRLMHLFTFAGMTRSLSKAEQQRLGGLTEWGIIPADPLGSTVRRYRDRLLVRNTFTYNPSIQTTPAQIARIGRRHDRSFAKRFPMLKEVSIQYRWGGALCFSLNSVPAFGEVADRIYSAVCQNGLGVVKGTYAGIAVVDLATRQTNQIVDDISSYDLPRKLYPEPLMTIGAKAVLWWKQKKAAKEF